MILFKACPRCGGDVDATYRNDAFCIQCSHRPQLADRGPVIAVGSPDELAAGDRAHAPSAGRPGDRGRPPVADEADGPPHESPCPRCGRADLLGLEKLRARDNTCYRCRPCGHIFSPAAVLRDRSGLTVPARDS